MTIRIIPIAIILTIIIVIALSVYTSSHIQAQYYSYDFTTSTIAQVIK